MLKFALKNMAVKKGKVLLIILSIVISASVAVLAYNVAEQVDDGMKSTAGYYDMIVGPSGSATQLAMNTMFFTEKPLGTISYEYVEMLEADERVRTVVPFTMGDSYNAAKIVGTTPAFLSGKTVKTGEMFDAAFEAVVGAGTAKAYGLSVGDTLVTSHGLSEGGHKHEGNPLTMVGILSETKTAYDNVIFTAPETVWATHDHGTHEEGEDHEGHEEHGEVCAILVKTKSFGDYAEVSAEYGAMAGLLTINPTEVLREVLENVDMSAQIVYILCIVILVMNIFIISVITLLNLYDSKKEIALMRLIGIGMPRINLLYLIQNAIIGFIAVLCALGVSRICLLAMRSYVATMGIVLDAARVYPAELMILAAVLVISVLPTVIATTRMVRKDGIAE